MQKTLEAAQTDFLSTINDMMREMHMKTKQLEFINAENKIIIKTLSRIEDKIDNLGCRIIDVSKTKNEELY
jgi:hypothetical protein